jgi:hypothetical protein
MDGKDVEMRIKQNVQFLRDRSGSGQVPPEYLCQILEEIAFFLGQAHGSASSASDMAKGVMNKIQALEQRFTPQPAQVVVPTPPAPALRPTDPGAPRA